jgi:hypothetical protein
MSKSILVKNWSLVVVHCIFSYQKSIACNKSAMEMGGVSWRGGSRKIPRPVATTQLKMEDVCTFIMWLNFFVEEK